jgi:DNA-binding NarL/FixJ family response regulator
LVCDANRFRHYGAEMGLSVTNERYSKPVSFTPAGERVLPLLATYLTLNAIADRLSVRRSTVKTHVVSIYKKLGVTDRTQAVERAEERGLLTPAPMADPVTPARAAGRRR